MKKLNISLIFVFCLMMLSGTVLANWDSIPTGPGGVSDPDDYSGGGGSYSIYYTKSRTRYTLMYLDGTVIATYDDAKGINGGNTVQWLKKSNGNYVGISNPRMEIGDSVFEFLLSKESKKPIDVIQEGKNDFRIKAEILLRYEVNGKETWLTYSEANSKGCINHSGLSGSLWNTVDGLIRYDWRC